MKKPTIQSSPDPIQAVYPDQFMQTLRQILEHIHEPAWLQQHAPLATRYFASAPTSRAPQLAHTGQKALDHQLRAIWHDWESRERTPLQQLIWEAVCALRSQKEPNYQALLLLTYFQLHKPKPSDIIQQLLISRATYYRYLEQALNALAALVINRLRPALRLEMPPVRPLVGREMVLAESFQRLQQGAVIHLVGGSGLGKTSVGAQLAEQWGWAQTFWYTFRPSVSDHLHQLLFALAYFLHQQGSAQLWLQLTIQPGEVSVEQALATLRQALAQRTGQPLLFCFDEVDHLLPPDGDRINDYAQIRAFLEAFAQSPRHGAPLLCIGQKLLLDPDPDHCFVLPRLGPAELATLLQQAKLHLPQSSIDDIHTYTRGNPLLLRLFMVWQRVAGKEEEAFQQISSSVSLDWFWARLRQRLSAKDEQLLQALAVHQGVAPRDLWRKGAKSLEKLLALQLVDSHAPDGVSLHPAIGAAIYRTLSDEERQAHHQSAALAYEQRAAFTRAAYHYVQGGQTALAVLLWYHHQESEINQGQAGAALALFEPLVNQPLPHPTDQKVLHLLLAMLYSLVGRPTAGLQLLEQQSWTAPHPTTAVAHAVRGHLLSHQGEIDGALDAYRQSIDLVTTLRANHTSDLYTTIGRHQLVYLRNIEQARQAALHAQFEVAVLQGEIESSTGNYPAACHHYEQALPLAEKLNNPFTLAKLHEAIGILHAYHEELETALQHIQQAGHCYQAYGNEICAVGMTKTNTAWANLLARRYAAVLPPAEAAHAYFTRLQQPYWLAINETNLAEAHCYLGNLDQAERYAEQALRQEETSVRPYCLYILGQIRRQQGHFALAERLCRDAITSAEANNDPWALAPAWRALGETYRDWGKADNAQLAFQEVLRLYQRLGVAAEIAHSQALLANVHA
ncbi:MAG: tetratricopeptide repeat protein [Caldilineaceae bacterium]|nr:tetratricopeptide repeat protein [Caldilineaceae bacterium]